MQKKSLFIHVPKTGGNSIQNVLRYFSEDDITTEKKHQDGIERFQVRNRQYKTNKHSNLSYYKSVLDPDVYPSLFKFSTIRNPWDKMISYYFSPHTGAAEWDRKSFLEMIDKAKTLRHYVCEKPLPGDELLDAEGKLDRDIDFFIRFERLDEDFKIICDRLDIPYTQLPKRNSSERTHYSKYYDDELKEIVNKKFIEEINFGCYSFAND